MPQTVAAYSNKSISKREWDVKQIRHFFLYRGKSVKIKLLVLCLFFSTESCILSGNTILGGCIALTGQSLPRRNPKYGRKIALAVGIALLVMLCIYLIVKRETIWYILNTDEIQMRSADEMRALVKEGGYIILSETEDELEYTAADGAVSIRVSTEGDKVTKMTAQFNAYDFQVNNVGDAQKYADELLSPYYTEPQIEALVMVVASDVISYLNAEEIDYSKDIGGYSLQTDAQIRDGNVSVEMTRKTS